MDGTDTPKVDVLVLGPKSLVVLEITKLLNGYQPYNLMAFNSIDSFLSSVDEGLNPQLALVSADKDTTATCEWVQSAKMNYPHVPVIVLHENGTPIDHSKVQKNGAKYIMHLFFDREFISDRILQLAPVDIDGDHIPLSALVAIHADDFEPGTKIDFNLYVHLPSNQKTLLFRKAGSTLDDKAINKIRTSAGQRVYVRKTQLNLFFKYSSAVLKQRNQSDIVSQTEKLQNGKGEIQALMTYFFDQADQGYEDGKKILERCESILKEFGLNQILKSDQIFQKLVAHTGQNQTIYNDCVNLCAYSTLFAKILGLEENLIRTAALAGLLCQIGLANLPRELFLKPQRMWTPQEIDAYKKYPSDSVNMIKRKKVALDNDVARVIEQHREFLDGSGFPFGHKGTQIHKLAKLVSIALHFQELTSLSDNRTALSPLNAINQMIKENIESGGKMRYDALMLQGIQTFIKSCTNNIPKSA